MNVDEVDVGERHAPARRLRLAGRRVYELRWRKIAAANGVSPGASPDTGSRLAPITAAWEYTSPNRGSHSSSGPGSWGS